VITDVDARLSTQPHHNRQSLRGSHIRVTHTGVTTPSQLQPHGSTTTSTRRSTATSHHLSRQSQLALFPASLRNVTQTWTPPKVASPPAATRLSRRRLSHVAAAISHHTDTRSTALGLPSQRTLVETPDRINSALTQLSRQRHSNITAPTSDTKTPAQRHSNYGLTNSNYDIDTPSWPPFCSINTHPMLFLTTSHLPAPQRSCIYPPPPRSHQRPRLEPPHDTPQQTPTAVATHTTGRTIVPLSRDRSSSSRDTP